MDSWYCVVWCGMCRAPRFVAFGTTPADVVLARAAVLKSGAGRSPLKGPLRCRPPKGAG